MEPIGGMIDLARQKKILISVPDALLQEVDTIASSQNVNRSQFIRDAMRLYIREKKRVELADRMKKGYEEMAEINLELAEFCVSADEQLQRGYEDKLSECE